MRVALLMFVACATTYLAEEPGCHAEEPGKPAAPLIRAHAHNDYEHDRPLLDALEHGFCSVEADIFLIGGELLVGHTRGSLTPERTLQALYLDPLKQRVAAHGGRVYPNGPGFTLLIDVKSDAEQTYAALHALLTDYAELLTVGSGKMTVSSGKTSTEKAVTMTEKAVTIVISGNRAVDEMANQPLRYAGIDGRVADLESDATADLLPLISDRWGGLFRWRGEGPIPDQERQKLRGIVTQAHQHGRRVRFWATPENERVWTELLDAQVDLIGTDDLPALSRFLRARP